MVIKKKQDFRLIPVLFAWWIKGNLLQVFSITQAFPGPLSRTNDPPDCFSHWLLPQERCLLLLQAWHVALVLKTDYPKKSWQQCYNRTRTTPFVFLKVPAGSFPPARNSIRELREQQQRKQEINFWSPEHQDMMTCLTLISACPTYQGREVLCLLRLY